MKPFIQDPQAWAAQSGYTLHRSPVDEKFLDVRKNETSIGVLVPDGENYQLYQAPVTTTSVSTAQEQVTDFISQSFTFGNPVEMHGLVNKGQKEFTLNEKVSGSGFVERISECNFWLPYAAEHYNISPDIRDYVLVPLPTINSGLPNTNGDSLSLNQMLRFDPQHGQQMYKTFRGKPTFLEHCFPARTRITTQAGFKFIEDIRVGDMVLTHKHRFMPVTELFKNGVKSLSRVRAEGYGSIDLTKNHPVSVVDRRQVFGKLHGHGSMRARRMGTKIDKMGNLAVVPHWRPVSDIYVGDYLVAPIYIGGDVHVNKHLAFLTGAFAAEGSYTKKQSNKKVKTGVVFSLGSYESAFIEKVISSAAALGYTAKLHYRTDQRSVNIVIKSVELALHMFNAVGEYSVKLQLKSVRSWDDYSLKYFLGGYISGDGSIDCVEKRSGRIRTVTVSRRLAYDIQNVWAKLGVPASVAKKDKVIGAETEYYYRGTTKIRKARSVYHVGVSPATAEFMNKYLVGKTVIAKNKEFPSRVLVVGKNILFPIIRVDHDFDKAEVFNFSVEEDHSYTAEWLSVHNCHIWNDSKGVILDCYLRPIRGFGKGKHYKMVQLAAFDRSKDPSLANSILDGSNNAYSVGFSYKRYSCAVCGHTVGAGASSVACSHTRHMQPTYKDNSNRLVFRKCEEAIGIELSSVKNPAFAICVGPTVLDPRSI